ncbi:hypothetical protein HS7_00930 [Sulfolobales archaeon HS-7]|nr:hypothetical protein HS7_00930 [Sulfolobales archaeon HS-7]
MNEVRHGLILTTLIAVLFLSQKLEIMFFAGIAVFIALGFLSSWYYSSPFTAMFYLPVILVTGYLLGKFTSPFLILGFLFGIALYLIWNTALSRGFSDAVIRNLRYFRTPSKRLIISSTIGLVVCAVYLFSSKTWILFPGSVINLYLLITSDYSPTDAIILIMLNWFSIPFLLSDREVSIGRGEYCFSIIAIIQKGLGHSPVKTEGRYHWVKSRGRLCLSVTDRENYNTTIIGSSGTGKSHLVKKTLRDISLNYIIIDIHGEYDIPGALHVDMASNGINPFSLFGKTPHDRSLEIASMLASVFNLGSIQTVTLANLIHELYQTVETSKGDLSALPTFEDLKKLMEAKVRFGGDMQEIAVIQRLLPYVNFLSAYTNFSESEFNVEGGRVVIDFSKVVSDELRYILLETFLSSILGQAYRRGPSPLHTILVIDEAPFLLSRESGRNIALRFFAEGRKFGIGTIIVSQFGKLVKEAINNSSTIICFKVNDPEDIDYMSRVFSSGNNEMANVVKSALNTLKRGEFIIKEKSELILGRSY